MKRIHLTGFLLVLTVAAFLAGCGHAKEESHEEGGHEEPDSGASYKPGKGVMISEETRKILGLEVTDVTEEILPNIVRLNVQIFSETHRFSGMDMDHADCDVHGSGYISPDQASLIEPKQLAKISTTDHQLFDGFVLSVKDSDSLAQGETEVLVGVKDPDKTLKDGNFVTAAISISRKDPVIVVPSSSLLRTVEGTFVYAVNGDAYYRTAVKVGSETDGKIEISDGLFAGDQVVSKPVETLWLIELRATKGGGHSH